MTSTITISPDKEPAVLIVGAAGQLGDMVVKCWPGTTPPVATGRRAKSGITLLDPIVAPDDAARIMAGAQVVVCFAGATPAAVAQCRDVYSSNTDVARATIDAAFAARVDRVFLMSSAAVYSGTTGTLSEDAVLAPTAEYGQAKAQMEGAAIAQAGTLGQKITILRIGNVAGADAILGGWKPGFVLDQLPDGRTPQRSYIGPQDLARVIHALAQIDVLPEVLNLSAPGSVQMGALLDAAGFAWQPRPAPDEVIADVTLCTDKLEKYVTFAAESGTSAAMVAQWRAYQDLCRSS